MSATQSLLIVFLLLLVSMYLGSTVVFAATGAPKILNYQGRLMDANSNLLGGSGTNYCFLFSIYDSPVVGSGTKLWPVATPSTMTISVKNGVFNAGVGDVSAGGDTLDYNFQDSDSVYLNVDVAAKVGPTCAPGDGAEVFESLSPRQRLLSSAYTVNSNTVGGYVPSQNASGNQLPALTSGNLILGGVNPTLSATTTNALTIQGNSSGNINFFNVNNRINSTGNMTLGGSLFLANGTATSTLQSSSIGTSTIQGFLSVLGTNSTSTFAGGLSAQSFAVTGGATSTFSNGLNLATGCFSVNGACISVGFSTSSADFYVSASSTIPKTYTSNTFTATQTFGNASTTNISASYASSTQGFFGSVVVGTLSGFLKATAGVVTNSFVSLTADISGILGVANGGTGWANLAANTLLTGNGAGAVATTTIASSLQLSGGTLALNIGNANVWTGLQSFGNASTTLESVFSKAYFGGTATTTIDSAGNVAVAGTLNVTGNATLSNATTTNLLVTASSSILNLSGVNSTTTNATTTSFFATTARTGTLTSTGAVNFTTTLAVTGLTTLGSASSTLLESMTQFARTIQSTSTNALVFKTNFTSSAGLTLGSTSTPQMAALDTLNNRVTIGTGGGTPTLFVVDTKNTLGDPAGIDGAQYYNSNTAQYRCYASGSWRTCGGQAASSTGDVQFKNTDGSFTAISNFNWNLASNGLTITGNPGQTSSLFTVASSSGAVMFDITSAGILELATTTDPVTPASGINIYAKEIAGRVLPKWLGPSGVDTPFQANFGFNRVAMIGPGGGAALTTAITAFNTAFTNTGTVANPTPATTNLLTSVRRTTFSTGATANRQTTHVQNTLQVTRGNASNVGGFFFTIRFGTSATVVSNRMFVGLADSIALPTNVDPTTNTTPGKVGMAINANTGNWKFVWNVTGSAPTVSDLGASFPVDNTSLYELIMFSKQNGTAITWRVTNLSTGAQIASTTGAANIPTNTTYLAPTFWASNNATAAAAIIDFAGWYLESDN